jgi:hypothetical protein
MDPRMIVRTAMRGNASINCVNAVTLQRTV